MRANGVTVETSGPSITTSPRRVADMTEHGWDSDEWPVIFEQVMAADILVLCTPIWLGEKSSVCTHIIERLYGNSSQPTRRVSTAYYGRVGGCIVTATRTA